MMNWKGAGFRRSSNIFINRLDLNRQLGPAMDQETFVSTFALGK